MCTFVRTYFFHQTQFYIVEQGNRNNDEIFSKRVRAGRRRTYFFDVRTTRSNDYYITITESKRRFEDDGYERHKLHLYKEDFNKFLEAFQETVEHVKTELLPDYDFDEFSHQYNEDYNSQASSETTSETEETASDDEETVESEAVEEEDAEDTEDENWD